MHPTSKYIATMSSDCTLKIYGNKNNKLTKQYYHLHTIKRLDEDDIEMDCKFLYPFK